MFTLIASLHVVIALLLILFVLVQDAKGGGSSMFAGGGSQSVLGATGSTNLLVKVTRVLAVLFSITCIGLTYLTAQDSKSVLEGVALPPAPVSSTPTAGTATPETPASEKTTSETPSAQ